MAKPRTYHEQTTIDYTLRLRDILKTLPAFAQDFFRAIEPTSSIRTRMNYAYDIRVFYHYLIENNPVYRDYDVSQFTMKDLERLEPVDLEEYMEYLKIYKRDDDETMVNGEKGLARKMSALRSFYGYYYKRQMISKNPTLLVEMPKIHEKAIVRLDVDEVAILLDEVESGENLTTRQKAYHAQTKKRDLALLTLLLGTGIRVSECVGLDLTDIDFKNNGLKVHRKGGYEAIVYFGDEVAEALMDYMNEREKVIPVEGSANALFLSMQKKRISVRSVENLVKKYSQLVTTLKNITPHKLRSTYGTTLYQETGDIYLVADVLGHKDVNTTRKHYAAQADERRRQAAKVVRLRDK